MKNLLLCSLVTLSLCSVTRPAYAESQGNEYKGITDPFGDPANYEFAEDEKDDKEFFHLGRFLMVGLDVGIGIFTGGLGQSVSPAPYVGAKVQYFFDRSFSLELAGHFADHLDQLRPNGSQGANIDTVLIPVTLGFRYYFDTKNAPKAIAIANPYLGIGGGLYFRTLTVTASTGGLNPTAGSTTSFGAYGAGGVEFALISRHLYLGLDLRYNLVFWPDADSTFGGVLQAGDRNGGYFTTAASITYNF